MGVSGGSSSSRPVDVTPTAFQSLQVPFANILASLMGVNPTPSTNYNPFTGTTPGANPTQQTSAQGTGGKETINTNQPQALYQNPAGNPNTGQPRATAPATVNGQNTNLGGTSGTSFGGGPGLGLGYGGGGGDVDRTNHPFAGTTASGTGTSTQAANGPYNQAPFTSPNDVLRGIPTYQGQTTAPLGQNEQTLLSQLMQGNGNQNYLNSLLSGTFLNSSPQVNAQQVNGVPQINAQQIGGVPQVNAQQISQGQLPTVNPQSVTAQQISQNQLPNVNAQTIGAQTVGQNTGDINYGTGGQADPYAGMQLGDVNNPLLTAYIQAAQRPTMENLTETLTRDLPGRFTAAGQFVQPSGSSAFDRAGAIATRGAANAIGDIATNIGYQGYNLDRNLQASAINDQQNRELAAATGTAGNRLTAAQGNQNANLAAGQSNQSANLSGQQSNLSALLTALQGNQNAALSAAQGNQNTNLSGQQSNLSAILAALQGNQSANLTGQQSNQSTNLATQTANQNANLSGQTSNAANNLAGQQSNQTANLNAQTANQNAYETERGLQQGGVQLNQQEVQNTIANLQAQALPRLIQQYGLDQGLQQFNNQVNNLMTLLQTAGGVTHPVVGNQSSSAQAGINLK